MTLENTIVLQFSNVHFVVVSSPIDVDVGGESLCLSPEDDSDEAFEPVSQLIGQMVDVASTDAAGALIVTFKGGGRLKVEPDPRYEAWNVAGPDGALVVSMPGGELAVWSARPGGDGT